MTTLRLALLAFIAWVGVAAAQVPPPVPALPDTPRITTYSLSASNCDCAVNFALYGDSTDYWDWVEVWINGINVPYNGLQGWTITSPTGPLATIPRPVTDAVLTFTAPVTGTVEIVGARRPRRVTEFSESHGVPARDLNQAFNDVTAQNRETWDRTNDLVGRAIMTQPGNVMGNLPIPANCINAYLQFDVTGLKPTCVTVVTPGTLTLGAGVQTALGIAANAAGGFLTTISSKFLTPQDFGALCNGTDEHADLQNWLNSLSSNLAGYIPPGSICAFATALTVPSHNGITIYGAGAGSSELRWIGTSAVTPITVGATNNSCSISTFTIHDLLLSSTTLMTAGSAINFYDVCELRAYNLTIANNQGGAFGNWFQGIGIVGGNQLWLDNNVISGSSTVVLAYGDATTQMTDLRINGGIIIGGVVGVNIGGNVGGFNWDGTSVLQNGTSLKISQDFVAKANLQIFLGPKLQLDATSGGTGRNLDIEDAGSGNSILTITGTWFASAANACVNIAGSTAWSINWTGGQLVNCGTDGIANQSTVDTLHITGLEVNSNQFSISTGFGFNCTVANNNVYFKDIHFISWGSSGQYSGACSPQSYTSNNSPEQFSNVIQGNKLNPQNGWQYDTSSQAAVAINSTSNAALPDHGEGLVIVGNQTNGDIGVYICGGGTCVLISSTLGTWVASTTAPASGKMSVAYSGTVDTIYNNFGSNVNTNIQLFKVTNF